MPPLPDLDLNWLAILVAAVSAFALGGLWYGVFKNAWCREMGMTQRSRRRTRGASSPLRSCAACCRR